MEEISSTTLRNVFSPMVLLCYVFIIFSFLLQITGKFPFKTDIVLVSGTGSESSRVEDRVSSLTGLSALV